MEKTFVQVVDQLAIWKHFPTGKERGILAAKLAEWCEDRIERAEWLASHVDDFDEYPGPATLRKMICDQFRPSGPLKPAAAYMASVPDCGQCGDLGTYYDSAQGKNVWCSCSQAQRIKADMPAWIDVVNQTRMPGTGTEKRKREENFAKIMKNLTEGYGA